MYGDQKWVEWFGHCGCVCTCFVRVRTDVPQSLSSTVPLFTSPYVSQSRCSPTLYSPVPMFHSPFLPRRGMPYVSQSLCFPVPLLPSHSKNKVVKWTTLGLSNWCQKRTPQSRPKLVIWVSRRMTTLISSQKQPESRQMTTFLLVSLSYDDLVITLERLNDKPQIVKWWSCD